MIWLYTIGAGMFILFIAWLIPSNKPKPEQVNEMQTVMDSLEHFVGEMEKDNQELLDMVKQIKRDQDNQISKLHDRVDYLERQTHDLSQKLIEATIHTYPVIDVSSKPAVNRRRKKVVMEDALPSPSPVVSEHEPTQNLKERYQQVFQLYSQGKSIDQIARKLEMNKGEVQLIIQLSQQEAQIQ